MVINKNNLLIWVLALLLFPRVIVALGFPKALVFAHYALTPLLYITKVSSIFKDSKLRTISVLMLLFILVAIASSIINDAGLINLILSIIMILSPVMLLLFISSANWSAEDIYRLEKFVVIFSVVHISMSFFQFFVMRLGDDDIEGVFIGMGAGGHLAGAVAVIVAFWVYEIKWLPKKVSLCLILSLLLIVFISDSKQVIAVLAVAAVIFIFISGGGDRIKYIGSSIFIALIIYMLANTIFPGLLVYLVDNKLFDGLEQKLAVFPVTVSFYDGWASWLFGLGPGHTVSRLATMMPDYPFLEDSLGATSHNATEVIILVKQSQLFSNSLTGSSMFALDFSLAGVWGDFGLLGILIFLLIYLIDKI